MKPDRKVDKLVGFLRGVEYPCAVVEIRHMGGAFYPTSPWPLRLIVTREYLDTDCFEVMRLSFGTLVVSLLRNFAIMTYWHFMRVLRWVGFIDVPMACKLSWDYWRWAFWRVRKRRKEHLDAV